MSLATRKAMMGLPLIVAAVLGSAPATAPAKQPSRYGAYQAFGNQPRSWQSAFQLVDGVPLANYGSFVAYNPVTIEQFGLVNYSLWARYGERARLSAAENSAGWLLHTQRANGTWVYSFPWTPAGSTETLAPGWTSALAQGQAISLLERAYHLSHNAAYLHAIDRALRPLATLGSAGLKRHFRGGTYFEEYPTKTVNFSMNGDAQTLIGLYDVSNLSPLAGKLFDEGVRTLERDLPLFDSGKAFSLYSIAWPYHPPPGYDPLIQDEMRVLAAITGKHVFKHYAERWYEP